MIPKKFKIEHEHLDFNTFMFDSENHGFNTIVIATMCSEQYKPLFRIGRLVQVRKDSGCFGTDTMLIRMANGRLQSWENVSFCQPKNEYKELYDSFFKKVELDEPNMEYTICGELPATGFIITDMDCTKGETYSFDMALSKDKISFSEIRKDK